MTEPIDLPRRRLLFILSSPSGAGKSTLARRLLETDGNIGMSVSATTRPMRPGEVDGRDYRFVTDAEFEAMEKRGEFLEWAHVFDNRYGTPKAEIEQGLTEGRDFLFDIDWQGTQQLAQRMPNDVVRVFILPPSVEELRRRLETRATDSAEVIDARMAKAKTEMEHWDGYEYVLVNDDLDACFAQVRDILAAERLKRSRRTGLIDFARALIEG